ncbi:nitrous oxide-stimulated promoter family protein [Lonsdalea britannica]|uniref:nitrous oxide-stimulated promoter family protein n=1 Tax=Lonsdalea britannica TaxID=1082704 RepID=UPI0026ED0644|nr:nitrous oxide-stimulated promoter family protein [Lonsdalea britannica]
MHRSPPGKRIQREIRTVEQMIKLYAKSHPVPDGDDRYTLLFRYAIKRLNKCYFGEEKPACKQCPIHCYQPAKREVMKLIMRWSGPRMLLHHPVLALQHLWDDRRPVPEISPVQTKMPHSKDDMPENSAKEKGR